MGASTNRPLGDPTIDPSDLAMNLPIYMAIEQA